MTVGQIGSDGVQEIDVDLRIDPSHSIPIYAQVVDQVKALVASRALRPGDSLPSLRDLATSLRINRNTAAKAYQILEAEGVLETRQGQGSVVAEGGTRWSREERRRRLAVSLDRTLVEAHHLEIPPEEVVRLLEDRIRIATRRARAGEKA
jgi:GntR family transcriptional regulator